MIDEATVERWMQEANPIPTLDDVDADEFARFVAAAHTRRAAVMQAPTQHPSTPTTPLTQPPQRRRKAWAFAAAFILIIGAVGIAALVIRDGDEVPVTDEPATPSQVQSLAWLRAPHDEAVFNPTLDSDMMLSVTAGGPGFVAVGASNIGAGLHGDAAVWISQDGISWSLVPNDAPPLRRRGAQWMESVTAGGPGLVAVGGEHNAGEFADQPLGVYAVVWTSEDGISWTRVPLDPAVLGAEAEYGEMRSGSWMLDVTAGGPGLVAVGLEGPWTSVDGVTWNRVDDESGTLEEMLSVTAGGPGLVAVGRDALDAANRAVVWTSPDGLTWTRVPHDEAVFGTDRGPGMLDVVAGGPGVVAVGGVGNSAAVWTSPDGSTWTRVPHDPEVFDSAGDSESWMNAIASTGSQLVAIGVESNSQAGWMTAAWTSVDGTTWTRAPFDAATTTIDGAPLPRFPGDVYDAVTTANGLIVVGQELVDGEQEDVAAAVWIASDD